MKIAVANGEKLLVKGRGNAEPQVSKKRKFIHEPDVCEPFDLDQEEILYKL